MVQVNTLFAKVFLELEVLFSLKKFVFVQLIVVSL